MLSTAAGGSRVGDALRRRLVPEGADQQRERVHTDRRVGRACHECPPRWVRCLSLENVERRTTPESTTITKTRRGF